MEDQTSFQQWLRERRKEYGYTQKELARLAGCSAIALRRIEAGALRPSSQLAGLLAATLGVPSEEQVELVRRARTGPLKPSKMAEHPSEHHTGPAHRLPTYPTTFIGREQELAELTALLSKEGVRLLVLTGAGGSGKTRLAVQLAHRVMEQFSDGVYFVSLAAILDPELVLPAVARSLDITEQPGQPLLGTLKAFLKNKQALILVDNFERVVEAAPQLSQLSAEAPRLKILVTSRAVLNVYGEQEYEVPPLPLPDLTHLLPPELDVEQLCENDSVRLFIDRGRAARPDFEPNRESLQAVAELCVRLDGLPLAIELAAARLRVLPPQAMLAQMGHRLRLLTGGARDVPTRQQTLRSALEWSYDLLDDAETRLFSRLGVFEGGCSLQAIQEVCDADDVLGIEVLDGVQSLVDKSLLREREGVGGEPRFVMLETIHEYAKEKAEKSGEGEELRRRHADYFLKLAEEAETRLRGPEQILWLDRLDEEQDNIHVVLGWALHEADVECASRLGVALGHFWFVRGYWTEGRRWLERALALHRPDEGREEAGQFRIEEDGKAALPERVAGLGAQGVVQSQAQVLAQGRAAILSYMGLMANKQGDLATAQGLLEQSAELSRSLGLGSNLAWSLFWLGATTCEMGDRSGARRIWEESLRVARQIGNKWTTALVLSRVGPELAMQGESANGIRMLEEGLALSRELGDRLITSMALVNLGEVVRLRGEYRRALDLYEEGLAVSRQLGYKYKMAAVLANIGYTLLHLGELQSAYASFIEAVELAGRRLQHRPIVAVCLVGLAGVAEAGRAPERAARLIGAADALLEESGFSLEYTDQADYDAIVAATQARTGDAAWQKAWQEGRTMSMKNAVEYVLGPQPRSVEEAIEYAVQGAQGRPE